MSELIPTREEIIAMNELGRAEAREFFITGSYSVEQVRRELSTVHTEPEVDEILSSGRLRHKEFEGQVYYPAWQLREGAPRPDLDRIFDELDRYTTSLTTADRVMRLAEHDELGGATILVALDDPELHERAWAKLGRLGEGF